MFFGRLKVRVRTLRFRLMVWNALVVVLTALVTLVGVREGVLYAIQREIDQVLTEDLYELQYKIADLGITMADLRPSDGRLSEKALRLKEDLDRKALGHQQHGWFVQLFALDGRLLWSSDNTPGHLPAPGEVADFRPYALPGFRLQQNRLGRPAQMVVRVGTSTLSLDHDMHHIDRLVAIAAGSILLTAPWIGYWLAGRATGPLSEIIRTTSRLRPTRMGERLRLRRTGDELDRLAQTINGFLNRMADHLQEKEDFLANSAHELRTPVAAIRSSVEVALGCDRSREEYMELLAEVLDECMNLEALVQQLLLLAETESDRLRTLGQHVNLSAVTEKALDMFAGASDYRQVTLRSQVTPHLYVEGNPHHLRQLINNLIDNAIKFTPPGGTVDVELTAEGEEGPLRLLVRDTGRGIPAEDLPHVFERFFRGDRARTHDGDTRGTGLGLSICKRVVDVHGGQISVASQSGEGTTATVRLPRLTVDQLSSGDPQSDAADRSAPSRQASIS